MKVLVLTTNTIHMACPRFRIHQYVPFLEKNGIQVEIRPFLDRATEQQLYRPGGLQRKAFGVLSALLRRVRDVADGVRADLIYILREASLVGPPVVEWLLSTWGRRPVIFDLDDPLWEQYDSPTYGRLAMLLKMPGKTHALFDLANCVVAGNRYVADYARQFNRNVRIIPTVVDTDHFRPRRQAQEQGPPVVGWIGSHSTLQHLKPILPALRDAARKCTFRLVIMGAGEELSLPGVDVDNRVWSLDTEIDCFKELDIGLYPLTEDNWSVGKSAFKAVQYGAVAIPTVGSPVGAVTSVVDHGTTGLIAESPRQWADAVAQLVQHAELRRKMGAQARRKVKNHFSTARWAPELADLMRKTVEAR